MSRINLPCGCYHDGPGHTWQKCERHKREDAIERRMERSLGAPKCPECNVAARRPKCMWELGGACPRHEVMNAWTDEKRRRIEADAFKRAKKGAGQ